MFYEGPFDIITSDSHIADTKNWRNQFVRPVQRTGRCRTVCITFRDRGHRFDLPDRPNGSKRLDALLQAISYAVIIFGLVALLYVERKLAGPDISVN
jgi:hypothetical protein